VGPPNAAARPARSSGAPKTQLTCNASVSRQFFCLRQIYFIPSEWIKLIFMLPRLSGKPQDTYRAMPE
jgi:hypothetical protein